MAAVNLVTLNEAKGSREREKAKGSLPSLIARSSRVRAPLFPSDKRLPRRPVAKTEFEIKHLHY